MPFLLSCEDEGCEVVTPPKPVKGLIRLLQKAQEEYEGDYTRILDYARISLVFDRLPGLVDVLGRLLAKEREPHFVALRTKDRLSREWGERTAIYYLLLTTSGPAASTPLLMTPQALLLLEGCHPRQGV